MTIAELHGKLSPDREGGLHDRLEDLLTSDVFGTMRYVDGGFGFLDWLTSAVSPIVSHGLGHRLGDIMPPTEVAKVAFAFWPMLGNGREPDVALFMEVKESSPLVMLVEAKYLSGPSDFEVPDGEDERGRTGNQIADQVKGLDETRLEEFARWFDVPSLDGVSARVHLLVTADTRVPDDVYTEAARRLKGSWSTRPFWLSWTWLAKNLEHHANDGTPGERALVRDLLALLERKGLVPFAGFESAQWRTTGGGPSFWTEEWWTGTMFASRATGSFWAASGS